MIRHLWTFAWATSLLLFVFITALWIKSYVQPDYLSWSRSADNYLESTPGKLSYMRHVRLEEWGYIAPSLKHVSISREIAPTLPRWPQWTHTQQRSLWLGFWPTWHGLSYTTGDYLSSAGRSTYVQQLIVPYWMLAAWAALLPALRLITFARRRGHGRQGYCVNCGYDLRATSERCPECGVAIGNW